MILRRPLLNATATAASLPKTHVRNLQHSIPIRPAPKPTPFIPDHTSFLTAIGRGLSAHAAKIPSWEALFTLSSHQLKELGVEPARSRKYLLHWREKFRNGEYGIGGDCQHVTDGVAELKLMVAPVGPHPLPGMHERTKTHPQLYRFHVLITKPFYINHTTPNATPHLSSFSTQLSIT
ncbi:hypothetical protein GRF29_1536g312454 [Pseudopithomyces chartarum]|uniref:Small ribosomal subunit protein mS41 n=1 Tax=Pseudopithomyces chartarum TaxID=1892770 RepID=A0AAN6LLF9_9PLEO|nr:hypothetical protein GRF29_1536g312454 [Pseudopithomyces chartarum]